MTADIENLPFWVGRPRLTPIESGRTNRNFMAEDNGARFFVRSGRDIPHLGISRQAERRAHAKAAAAGLAPAIRFAQDGVLITEFVTGTGLDSSNHQLAEIARHLKRLHDIPADDDLPLFCPTTVSLVYLDRLGAAELPFDKAMLRHRLETLPRAEARCLVHGDLIPENFILRDEGGLSLIDWEYAGNGQAEVDIALLIANFDLAAEAAQNLVAIHGGVDPDLVAQFQVAATIRETLWCFVQMRFGTPSTDLPDYARKCTTRLSQVLA